MLTVAIDTAEVTLANNAVALVLCRGDVDSVPVTFTKDGAAIAPPDDLALAASLVKSGGRGGNGILASATGFTRGSAGVGAALITLDLSVSAVDAALANGTPELAAEFQLRITTNGTTRHTAPIPARLVNTLFA